MASSRMKPAQEHRTSRLCDTDNVIRKGTPEFDLLIPYPCTSTE